MAPERTDEPDPVGPEVAYVERERSSLAVEDQPQLDLF